tara:strand:- start:13084 stop:13287 length:204 start_codon:yes stop_codon:yes gene_type:complete
MVSIIKIINEDDYCCGGYGWQRRICERADRKGWQRAASPGVFDFVACSIVRLAVVDLGVSVPTRRMP